MAPQVVIRVSAFTAALGMLLAPAFGQARGGGGGTTSGGTSGASAGAPASTTGPSNSRNSTTGSNPSQTTQPGGPAQPIFLSGRVMLEDGTPPAESVLIERVCSGQPHAEGYTDSKGYFAIQLGAVNSGVLQDASEENTGRFGGGLGGAGGGLTGSGMGTSSPGGVPRSVTQEQRLLDCELRAKLAGYRSQSVSLANHRAMDTPDIGTILLHRLGATEGTTVSAISLAAPKDAHKAFEKGLEANKKRKTEDARRDFEKAVELYPHYAAAWCELGRIQAAAGELVDARQSFDSAVKADPRFVSPYLEISVLDLKAQSWKELAEVTDKVASLDAFDYPEAFYFNAVANYYLKNLPAAEKSARQAEKLDTRHELKNNPHLLGVILAQRQDYAGAVAQLKMYLRIAPEAQDAEKVRSQVSQLEKALAEKQPQQ